MPREMTPVTLPPERNDAKDTPFPTPGNVLIWEAAPPGSLLSLDIYDGSPELLQRPAAEDNTDVGTKSSPARRRVVATLLLAKALRLGEIGDGAGIVALVLPADQFKEHGIEIDVWLATLADEPPA